MKSSPASPDSLPMDWVREQFPTLANAGILMDNAGGSVPLGRVVDRLAEYMRKWPVQLGASYLESAEAQRRLGLARTAVAGLLGPQMAADEIVVAASTTSLISRLARSLVPGWDEGDEVIVTDVDHEANITPWRRLTDHGIRVREWSLNQDSRRLEIDDLRSLLSDRTRLVCFTHASNILGQAVDVETICATVHEAGAKTCIDGVAYAPHRPLAVKDWGVDYYAFSLYKVLGPHCAVMYCRDTEMSGLANLNHIFMDDYEGPGRLELGAFPYESLYAAGGVPDYLDELAARLGDDGDRAGAWSAIAAQESRLTRRLLEFLDSRPTVEIMGSASPGPDRMPTISFVSRNHLSSEIPAICDRQGIGIRWGHFYAPRLIDRLGLTQRDGVVRVSMLHYNTVHEVDRLIGALEPALRGRAA